MRAVDYSARPADQAMADELARQGYIAAARYVSEPGRRKNMTPEETRALTVAGLSVVTVFETSTTRTLGGRTAGREDGVKAAQQAEACGAPADSPIFFAVDFDARPQHHDVIADYFRGCAETAGQHPVCGYGHHDIGRAMLDGRLAAKWWQCAAWSRGRRLPDAVMFQRVEQATVSGVTCDVNDVLAPDFGGWKVNDGAAFVRAAAREVGYTECSGNGCRDHDRRNHTKFAAEAEHLNGYAWCATFVVAIARRLGITLPSESAYTPTMANAFKKAGRWHATPQVGDVPFFDFPDSKRRIQHTGILESWTDTTVTCIEGNTSAGTAGSQDNGGGVYRRTRPRSHVVGFGRPMFSQSEEDDMFSEEDRKLLKATADRVTRLEKAVFEGAPDFGVPSLQVAVTEIGYSVAGYDLPEKPSLIRRIATKLGVTTPEQ